MGGWARARLCLVGTERIGVEWSGVEELQEREKRAERKTYRWLVKLVDVGGRVEDPLEGVDNCRVRACEGGRGGD